jgi:hypothetical protein
VRGDPLLHQWKGTICESVLLQRLSAGHGDRSYGSLDDPNRIAPDGVVYCKDALDWDHFDPQLPRFDRLPQRTPP